MSKFEYNPLTGRFDIVGEGGSGGGEGISLVHTLGNSTTKAMSQMGVTTALNALSTVPEFDGIDYSTTIKPTVSTEQYTGNDGVVIFSDALKIFLYKVNNNYIRNWSSVDEYMDSTLTAPLPNKIFKNTQDKKYYAYSQITEGLELITVTDNASYDDLVWLLEVLGESLEESYVQNTEVVVLDWNAMPTVNGEAQYSAIIASGKRVFYRDVFPGGDIILFYQPDTTKVAPYCNSGEMIFRTGNEIPSILSNTGEIKWVKEPVFKANSTYVITIDYTFVDPGNNLMCAMWAEIPNQTE